MTYSQLLHDLAQLNLHPLADTNVNAVTDDRGAAILEFHSEEEALKAELKEADKRLVASEQETNDMEARALKAEELLDEVKSEEPEEKGRTLRQYKEDAEQADMRAANWKAAYYKMEAELKELRRRKSKPKSV